MCCDGSRRTESVSKTMVISTRSTGYESNLGCSLFNHRLVMGPKFPAKASIMQFIRDEIRRLFFGLIAIAATGCQSVAQSPLPFAPTRPSSSGSDCEKADAMWHDKILPSRYAQLPPLSSPGIIDSIKLMTPNFSVKALTFHGDELEPGRKKTDPRFWRGSPHAACSKPKRDSQKHWIFFNWYQLCYCAVFPRKKARQ